MSIDGPMILLEGCLTDLGRATRAECRLATQHADRCLFSVSQIRAKLEHDEFGSPLGLCISPRLLEIVLS
jgi:hypothetical protein